MVKSENSKIQQALEDYEGLQPNSHIQRKIDYYFTPYIDVSMTEENKFQGAPAKYMKFDEAKDIYKEMNDSEGNLQKEYQDKPSKICDEISANAWGKVKEFVWNKDNEDTIQNIGRFILMKDETDDFLTKLDLIDTHPEVFLTDNPAAPKLSKFEIEQLRVIANGDK